MYKTKLKDRFVPPNFINAEGVWTVVCDFPRDKLLMFNEDGLFYDPFRNKIDDYQVAEPLQSGIIVTGKSEKVAAIYGLEGEWEIIGTDQNFVMLRSVETDEKKNVYPSRIRLVRIEE